MSWFSRSKHFGVAILGRYPFVWAILLMLILGERAKSDNNKPPFQVELLYGYLVLLIIFGVAMSYDLMRKEAAIGFVCQIGVSAYMLYSHEDLGYKPWLRNRSITRCFGLAGVYVIYAFLTSEKRNKAIQKIGHGCLALFTILYMFILVNSDEERNLFAEKIPFKTVSLFFLTSLMGTCAIIYVSGGIFVTYASQALMCINLALLLTMNGDINFWVNKRGTPFWFQIKLICDDIFICIGLYVMGFAKYYLKRRQYKKD